MSFQNIAILAHVDSGKTSITERLLFVAGAIPHCGNVDEGTAVSDSLDIEKQRGISVKAHGVSLKWQNLILNIIDTPGHADFAAEVERILPVVEGVVLVVSAVEGVQSHTRSLWKALTKAKIPVLLFVNKLDRAGADFFKVLADIEKEWEVLALPLFMPTLKSGNDLEILGFHDIEEQHDLLYSKKNIALENFVALNDELLDLYLNKGELPSDVFENTLKKFVLDHTVLPVFCGSAKFNVGIKELLNGITDILPHAKSNSQEPLEAHIFAVTKHHNLGRLAHVRLLSGSLKNRDTVFLGSSDKTAKVGRVFKQYTRSMEDQKELYAGDTGIIAGLPNVRIGDVLGLKKDKKQSNSSLLSIPLMRSKVSPLNEKDYASLAEALQELDWENPELKFEWDRSEKEMHVHIMGEVQIEVLQSLLQTQYQIDTHWGKPIVIYKETPAKSAESLVRYWMPKPCWAIMKFLIEPGERGSGWVYESRVGVNQIQQKYQNEVERAMPKVLEQGIKGWAVTDIKITLLEGEDHEMHSRPGDFIIATPMGIMRALEASGTCLLEPVWQFVIQAPEDLLGNISSDIINMRGSMDSPEFSEGQFFLKGRFPVSEAARYGIRLNSLSKGKANMELEFFGYEPVSDELGVIRAYKGVNPLDESQWILHARGAFKTQDWKY